MPKTIAEQFNSIMATIEEARRQMGDDLEAQVWEIVEVMEGLDVDDRVAIELLDHCRLITRALAGLRSMSLLPGLTSTSEATKPAT